MFLKKAFIMSALVAFLLSVPFYSAVAEDLSPIEGHVCNKILEFIKEKNEVIEITTIKELDPLKWNRNYRLELDTWISYGRCLVLNSEERDEKAKGIAILQSISDRLGNIYSAFFLAQYYEAELGIESDRAIEKVLDAYHNTIHLIESARITFWDRLKASVIFIINYQYLIDKSNQWHTYRTDGYNYRQDDLLSDAEHRYLFVDSINKDSYTSKIAYYKIPQLYLLLIFKRIREDDKNPLATAISPTGSEGQNNESIQIETAPVSSPLSFNNIIGLARKAQLEAENCMSYFEDHPFNDEWEAVALTIHRACEELKEIALDFTNGNSRSMTVEEIENLENFLKVSQEERISLSFP